MLIKEFKQRLNLNRGYAKNTVDNYYRTVVAFDNFLRECSLGETSTDTPEKIRLSHIEVFIQEQRRVGKEAKTCNNLLAGIKMFIRYCNVLDYKVLDTKRIIYSKEREREIGFLDKEDKEKLRKYVVQCDDWDELAKVRNQLMVLLFLNTGLRVTELINIKRTDVAQKLRVEGKGGVIRYLTIFDKEMRLFQLYDFLKPKKMISDYVFVSHAKNTAGNKLSRASVEKIIRKIGQNAGLSKPIHPHMLRHTFATTILENGGNISYIQKLMGHKNITTTQVYLGATDNNLITTQQLVMNKNV